MARSPHARVVGLLVLLIAVLGYFAVRSSADGTHAAGMWPVGLASGLLVHVAREHLALAAAGVLVLAFVTIDLAGYPTEVAAGYAVGIVLEGLVTQHVLGVRWGERRRLSDDLDMGRYTVAAVLGAATGATLFLTISAASGFGDPVKVGLATFIVHFASQLTLLAFFMEEVRLPGAGGSAERLVRWALTLAATLLAFVPGGLPSVLFFILPLLGWTALRASMREALWQLLTVAVIANTMAQLGHSPFEALQVIRDRGPELRVIPQQMFMLGCALVCIPFAMAVNRQRQGSIEAANERERLRRIVEGATGMAIIETDVRGLITLFNPGAEAILGYGEGEVLGHSPEMFHDRTEMVRQAELLGVPAELVHVGLALSGPGTGPQDWSYVRKDGEVRSVSMSLAPIEAHRGTVVGYLITAEDITQRVRTHDALEAALVTERRAVAHLTEVDRTKDAFVSSVSHELRTPITNIVGYLELLMDGAYGDTTGSQDEALGRIDANSHRLLELIDDLLTLSSIESLDVELTQEPVDLREVIRRTGARVGSDLADRRQRLDVLVPSEPVVVLGDEGHLERMVSNLATNAVKFTPDGGTIVLRLRTDGERPAIEVQDTGVGIPQEEQPLLFNRFFRSTYAQTEAIKGSGLGLSIARSIAQRHGARISATSMPGHGSVFTVTFGETGTVPVPRVPS
ncbi:MAG: sensor signal transduction histidine kinase [Marmoricola sp.]|nr:sensor signal transduction histidine kinase [Marmoricola sp.]